MIPITRCTVHFRHTLQLFITQALQAQACHDLQQCTVPQNHWVWLTSLFGKSSKKTTNLLKANIKLGHVFWKDVKYREKVLYLDNSLNYQLNHSPIDLVEVYGITGYRLILETVFQYNFKNTKHASGWKATCFFLIIKTSLSIILHQSKDVDIWYFLAAANIVGPFLTSLIADSIKSFVYNFTLRF